MVCLIYEDCADSLDCETRFARSDYDRYPWFGYTLLGSLALEASFAQCFLFFFFIFFFWKKWKLTEKTITDTFFGFFHRQTFFLFLPIFNFLSGSLKFSQVLFRILSRVVFFCFFFLGTNFITFSGTFFFYFYFSGRFLLAGIWIFTG